MYIIVKSKHLSSLFFLISPPSFSPSLSLMFYCVKNTKDFIKCIFYAVPFNFIPREMFFIIKYHIVIIPVFNFFYKKKNFFHILEKKEWKRKRVGEWVREKKNRHDNQLLLWKNHLFVQSAKLKKKFSTLNNSFAVWKKIFFWKWNEGVRWPFPVSLNIYLNFSREEGLLLLLWLL